MQIEPKNGEAYYYLALSQYKLKKYSDAKAHFTQALQYNIGERANIAKKYLQVIQKIEK